MATIGKVNWKGASGKLYTYEIHPMDESWNDVPGNYIFARQIPGGWSAVYIGETQSLKDRLPNHNELPCVRQNGGTHIHAHVNQNTQARLAEEADLLANGGTPCNG